MNSRRWKIYGVLYFTLVFILVPTLASAYIDPSVTTYAIQAIAGVAVAAGAFFATYGRRMKKNWMKMLDLEENGSRTREAPLEIYMEGLKEELEERRRRNSDTENPAEKKDRPRKNLKGRLLTSLLCGLAVALTVVLRPILSFFLSNESEFWFTLAEVILQVLAFSAAAAAAAFLAHFLLPGKGRVSLRLLFAACAAAGCLCVFVQNHFLSSYLPILTGDAVDWNGYPGWGAASLALWGGLFALFIAGTLIKPRWFKGIIYGLFALLICMETVTGAADLLSADRSRGKKGPGYFSNAGLSESSTAGNVVVIIADTFEGSFMNEILELYPEVPELLPEVTFYDNVTGISSLTYVSYPTFLAGAESPMGYDEKNGIAKILNEGTLIDDIRDAGWDVGYYLKFEPVPSMKDKILNYAEGRVVPGNKARWNIVLHLWKGSLFRSAPHQLKRYFEVSLNTYEWIRSEEAYTEQVDYYQSGLDNMPLYEIWKDRDAVTAVEGKPRYGLIQLWGLHAPCDLTEDYTRAAFDDSVPPITRKLKAGRAMLKLLRTYLDRLKEAGTYDNTTVILTTDHGFNMRYYTTLLVKEAGSIQTAFRKDHTPLSLRADFVPLVKAVTGGKRFSEAVADMNLPADRERYAVDFRPMIFGGKTDRRVPITIRGDAKDRSSYTFGHDEFILDEQFAGRCEPGVPFISEGRRTGSVAVYGSDENGRVLVHTMTFDAFFDTEETRALTLKIRLRNITENGQRISFRTDGETLQSFTLAPGAEEEFAAELPETAGKRLTLYMDLPDGEQITTVSDEVMPWMEFNSVHIEEAVFVPRQ